MTIELDGYHWLLVRACKSQLEGVYLCRRLLRIAQLRSNYPGVGYRDVAELLLHCLNARVCTYVATDHLLQEMSPEKDWLYGETSYWERACMVLGASLAHTTVNLWVQPYPIPARIRNQGLVLNPPARRLPSCTM